jgi:hypothetical protein
MSNDSPHAPHRPPHPLAFALIERLRGQPGARVLEIGAGSGRNTRALAAAGLAVQTLPASDCAGALATHALLHGTQASLAALLAQIARALEPDAPLYATFGSVHDARYGKGQALEPHVFAPLDGDEIGVAHAFFDEARLRALLAPHFTVESIGETAVDEIAGSWAHPAAPLRDAVHWFVIAGARTDQ